jgi:hypothetical protein
MPGKDELMGPIGSSFAADIFRSIPGPVQVETMTEETGKRILARLDDIDRQLSLLLTSGVQLDGELLRFGNTNEATARALMAEFDRRIGKG